VIAVHRLAQDLGAANEKFREPISYHRVSGRIGEFRLLNQRILVVEDEPLIRLGVISMLEDAGHDAAEAANADEAVRVLEKHPEIELVMTDIDMPGSMDGIKLSHYIRKRWPPVQLIIISGKVTPKPDELPPDAKFISKPYQEPHLLRVIGQMIGSGNDRH
jgi:CheY-like chemotaxis protein